MMSLYFYTNKQFLFICLCRNLIAPFLSKSKLITEQSLSCKYSNCFFVTHKRLNASWRFNGIADGNTNFPVVLDLSYPLEQLDNVSLYLIEKDSNVPKPGTLSGYNTKIHDGALIYDEIPFSVVSKFYFESQDDYQNFFFPSEDFWWPESKAFKLDNNKFSESISLDIVTPSDDLEEEIRKREKAKAMTYMCINATAGWEHSGYSLDIDNALQNFFELSDANLISKISFDYAALKDTREELNIVPLWQSLNDAFGETLDQKVYNYLCEQFMAIPYEDNTTKQGYFDNIMHKLKIFLHENGAPKDSALAVEEIRKFINCESDLVPENIVCIVPKEISCLSTLIYVLKNASNFCNFRNNMKANHISQVDMRRAYILWSSISGLKGVPTSECNKDNDILMNIVEQKVGLPVANIPYINGDKILGVLSTKIKCTDPIERIRLRLLNKITEDMLEDKVYEMIFECVRKISPKNFSPGKVKLNYYSYQVSSSISLQKGETFTYDEYKKISKKLGKELFVPKVDREKIKERLLGKESFADIYSVAPNYWWNWYTLEMK